MTYRSDLDALAARQAALESEVARSTRELDDTRRLLDEARARARLPVLDNIRIASPCRADWNEMTGDERVRACGTCHKQVFNLSALTRDEAEALIVERAGNLCARYYQRADGTILLADCEIGARKRRRKALLAAGALALLAGGGAAYGLVQRFDRVTVDAVDYTRVAPPPTSSAPMAVRGTAHDAPPPAAPRPRPVMGHVSHADPDARPTMGAVAFPVRD